MTDPLIIATTPYAVSACVPDAWTHEQIAEFLHRENKGAAITTRNMLREPCPDLSRECVHVTARRVK